MGFTYDTSVALKAAVALANSAHAPDSLTKISELREYIKEFGYTGRIDRDKAELERVRSIRPRLQRLLTPSREEMALRVNEEFAQISLTPRLVSHEHLDWHLHGIEDDKPLEERIMVETLMALVDFIRWREPDRIAYCADETCEKIVLDLSRNRSRIYCSKLCANRNAVAAYRARLAEKD